MEKTVKNIYEKLQEAKKAVSRANLKKSGRNEFAKFSYYELGDFMPTVISAFDDLKLYSRVSFTSETATLTIINAEDPEQREEFSSPMANLEIKGASQMQAIGGMQTYQRRYLFLMALDITESDSFNATTGKDGKKPTPPEKEQNLCADCGKEIIDVKRDGKIITTKDIVQSGLDTYGRILCPSCMKKIKTEAEQKAAEQNPAQIMPPNDYITAAQIKLLFATGREDIVRKIAVEFGYNSTKDILKKDFDNILKRLTDVKLLGKTEG